MGGLTSMRRRQVSRRSRILSGESIAGWVFADLLLVLFVVGLASAVPEEPPEPTLEPTRSPEPKIVGMETVPAKITIRFNAADLVSGGESARAEARHVCAAVRKAAVKMRGQRAALVLIFGGAPEATPAQRAARAVGKQLTCADPNLFPAGTPRRPFWDGGLAYGQARLEVFQYTTENFAPEGAG